MNKIFKIIFNRTTNRLEVVSELAKSKGKISSSTDQRSEVVGSVSSKIFNFNHITNSLILSLGLFTSDIALATYLGTGAKDNNDWTNVAIGDEANALNFGGTTSGYNGSGNVVIGYKAKTVNGGALPGSAQGLGNGSHAVILGAEAQGVEGAVAIGYKTNVERLYGVGIGRAAKAGGEYSVAIGSNEEANNTEALGTASLAMGREAKARGYASVAFGFSSQANQTSALAMMYASQANGIAATAIGRQAIANSKHATALGGGANALGLRSIALGTSKDADDSYSKVGAQAKDEDTIAIGTSSQAIGNNATAIGREAKTNGVNATALGTGSNASATNATAIGGGVTNKTDAIAIGAGATINGEGGQGAVAIGNASIVSADYGVALGSDAQSAGYSVAVGKSSRATKTGTSAFGENANATGERATALGNNAQATADTSVALGNHSVANVAARVTGWKQDNAATSYSNLTGNILTSTAGAVSVGNGTTITRQITSVAAGTNDTDAVNVAQLRSLTLGVSGNNNARGNVTLSNEILEIVGANGITTSVTDTNGKTTVTITGSGGAASVGNFIWSADNKNGNNYVTKSKPMSSDVNFSVYTTKTDGSNDQITLGSGDSAQVYKGDNLSAFTTDRGIFIGLKENATFKSINITDGPTLNASGINMNGDKITNVGPGTADTDAVNVSQLKNLAWKLKEGSEAPNAGFSVGNGTTVSLNDTDTIDVTRTDGNVKFDAKTTALSVTNTGNISATTGGALTNGTQVANAI
ncbi:ESPR-type extended signal peptide-containing protein, partial [uncultured Actinobacillus sp.]|uniref:ESPR-type extended signal peptide-containing protein n=1 Tax=uncultured Actinobacillus sp. TaxID=417616 RepID=UPI0025E4AB5E